MSWLDPLIDPQELVASAFRGNGDPLAGLALLLDGEFLHYERYAADSEWPSLGKRPSRGASPEQRLLSAVGLHLTDTGDASGIYDRLAKSGVSEDSFGTLVAVLHALYWLEREDAGRATGVLEGALRVEQAPLDRMLLELHAGVASVERGNIQEGLDATSRALGAKRRSRAQYYRTLRTVAKHNEFAYHQIRGQILLAPDLPLRETHLPLVRSAIDESVALEKNLEEQFDRATKDRYTRRIVWRPQDPVETRLRGALLRTQCLADWAGQNHQRRVLARYYVTSKLGTSDGVPPVAFELLRRAGDAKGLEAVSRSVAEIGPLGVLRTEVEKVAGRTWPQPQERAVLALIRGGGDLLRSQEADRAFRQFRSKPELITRHPVEGSRALARLSRSASDRAQTSIARFIRGLIQGSPEHILLLHELRRTVAQLGWEAVSGPERKQWLDYIEAHIRSEDDRRFLAESAAGALGSVEPQRLTGILIEAYEGSGNLKDVALLLDNDLDVPEELRRDGVARAVESLKETRDQARRGAHGFGGELDVPVLLLRLLEGSNDPEWDALTDFLLDERVSVDGKTPAIDALALTAAIPKRIQARFRESVGCIGGFAEIPMSSPKALAGAALRLWLSLGGLGRDELLSRLLELAGDLDREGRREAAMTLPAAQHALGEDTAFTLALSLTRDRDPHVRARAGQSLALMKPAETGNLAALVERRLESLLSELGTDVPYLTLTGLVTAQDEGRLPPRLALEEAVRLRHSHPSRSVQRLADALTGTAA